MSVDPTTTNGPSGDDRAAPAEGEARALAALTDAGIPFTIVRHGPVRSLAEAAAARGVAPADVVKTMVVRRAEDDNVLVLVPGDRTISWPRLRALLGVSRLSMPDAAGALAATGYERGTITAFGSLRPWPVVADERVLGHPVSVGAGGHGVAALLSGDDLVAALDATVADVTDPEG
jgi:Cys-tRNA(Pro) deacylase